MAGATRSWGPGSPSTGRRRFQFAFATDIKLPHTWVIALEFGDTDANGLTTLQRLIGAALFTLRNAAIGFALGSLLGLGLAIVLVHVRVLERSLVPIIVASQTIPIIAIAPLIVIGLKADWFGVAIVSTYLTFFPVTIAALRGLRALDPRALELMRSYAASRGAILRKLRLPASRPYLFTGFRIAAPAAVVGAIVGELPSLIQDGLARQIITGMQYYSLNAEYLWAAIVMSAVLGHRGVPARRGRRVVDPPPRATARMREPHDDDGGRGAAAGADDRSSRSPGCRRSSPPRGQGASAVRGAASTST